MTLALCFLAAALWLSAGGESRPSHRASRARSRMSPQALPWLASLGALVTAGALLGPLTGTAVGAVTAPVAWLMVRRLAARAHSPPTAADRRQLPLTLDLLATALAAGQPLPAALVAVAPAAGPRLGTELAQVAGLLRLGATPATAWQAIAADPVLASVARTACRSAESGIRLARGFEQLAAELRADAVAAGLARAHRAGVWAMAPLGLCFLPAFVCLGVVPTVVGVARGVFAGLAP